MDETSKKIADRRGIAFQAMCARAILGSGREMLAEIVAADQAVSDEAKLRRVLHRIEPPYRLSVQEDQSRT